MSGYQNIRAWRLRLGITGAAVSALTGIPRSTLSLFELGTFTLPFEIERRLVKTLTRVEALVSAYPVPINLGNVAWLKAALADWPEEEIGAPDRARLVELAERAYSTIRTWYGDDDQGASITPAQ